MDNRPIGVFDSGIGGMTVLSKLVEILPNENYIYLGDTARVPYGAKNKLTIEKYTLQAFNFFKDQDIKAMVIACNTATALAIDEVRKNTDIYIQGVINPGVKKASEVTKTGEVCIIGTKATIKSRKHELELKKINNKMKISAIACPLFVPIVEEGLEKTNIANITIDMYLDKIKHTNVDTLILGCTHYPFLKDELNAYFNNKIQLVDPALETAKSIKKELQEKNIFRKENKKSYIKYYTTDLIDSNFDEIKNKLTNLHIDKIKQINLDKY